MAPKPEPATLAYVFGIVLAVAAILAIMGWADSHWAAPNSSLIYHPQLPILY
jgi:ATP-dependent protease ClpP protease subunit